MNKDILFIRELKIETTIGIFPWEEQIKQNVILDIEIQYDIHKAAQSGDINDALDYDALARGLSEYIRNNSYKLIETLANDAAKWIFQQFKVTWLRLRVSKPAAVAAAKDVGVIIERSSPV